MDSNAEDDLIYLAATEKGFSKQLGFEMLSQMRTRFKSMFQGAEWRSAKEMSLNARFQPELKALHVKKL